MYLENIVFDSVDPHTQGRFWQALLGCKFLGEEAQGLETRLEIPGGPTLDLCFQRVAEAPGEPVRLHLDLLGGPEQAQRAAQAVKLGARRGGIRQHDVSGTIWADPGGNAFCVLENRPYSSTGPIAALPLDSADVSRDAQFWAWLTGWNQSFAGQPGSLRHRSGHGPLLELRPESEPKGPAKNRMHLDMRLESGDDAQVIAEEIVARGGRELHPNWGELAWRVYQDPSGNEFCVLPVAGGGNDD